MKTSRTRAAIATAAAVTITAGLIGAATGQTNSGSGAAHAAVQDNPVFENPKPSRQVLFSEAGVSVNGTVDGEKGQWHVAQNSVSPEKGSAPQEAVAYNIDMETEYVPDLVFEERYWKDAPVNGIEYIQWIMHNGHPNVTADALAAQAGVDDLIDDENEKLAATAATQSAVWNYANEFDLGREDPTAGDDDYDEVVLGIYDYLLENSAKEREPWHGFEIDGPDIPKPQDPFIINTFPDATKVTIDVAGGRAVNVDGDEIARVDSGEEFYIEPDPDVDEVVIEAYAEGIMPIGKLYEQDGKQGPQMLILAQPIEEKVFANYHYDMP